MEAFVTYFFPPAPDSTDWGEKKGRSTGKGVEAVEVGEGSQRLYKRKLHQGPTAESHVPRSPLVN